MDAQKEQIAIQRLKSFEPEDGYYLCYSGGKDSDVIRILADLAGVKHENVHNLTTVDAPETVQYIKSLPDVRIDYPKTTMWKLIEQKMIPPSRKMRYCCEVLKEHGGDGKVSITGVRWAESEKRAESSDVVKIVGKSKTTQKEADEIGAEYKVTKQGGVLLSTDNDEARRTVELCYRTRSTTVNPIVDWTDRDVWDFLHHYGCESNPLYQCGMHRIGCVGCPLATQKTRTDEFRRYKYALEFVENALDLIPVGHKVAMFLKLQFLEGKARKTFFEKSPPTTIYVSSSRIHCAMNGDFDKYGKSSAVAYAWFIWEKGNTDAPVVKWFN